MAEMDHMDVVSEPPGQRFPRMAGTDAPHWGRRVLSVPPVCPLERAFGHHVACTEGGCMYYRVPDVATECAIEHWAPSVGKQPALAAWFLAWREVAAS